MSESASQVTIQVLGKSLTLRCPGGQETVLESAAKELNSRLHTLRLSSKTIESEHLLILVALNLTVELTALQQMVNTEGALVNTKLTALQTILDEALIKI